MVGPCPSSTALQYKRMRPPQHDMSVTVCVHLHHDIFELFPHTIHDHAARASSPAKPLSSDAYRSVATSTQSCV